MTTEHEPQLNIECTRQTAEFGRIFDRMRLGMTSFTTLDKVKSEGSDEEKLPRTIDESKCYFGLLRALFSVPSLPQYGMGHFASSDVEHMRPPICTIHTNFT